MKAELTMQVGRRLDSLQWTPQMEQNVLRHIQEHTKPKTRYRLSVVVALVMLMVLLLATATAALLGWKPFAARVMELEPGSLRGFSGWSLESKLALVDEMREADMDVSIFADIDHMSETEQDAWLTKNLKEIWSGELSYASGNILEHIRGPFYTWSLEDKAWYSQQLLDNNRIGSTDMVNLLPGPDALSTEEVILKAEDFLLKEYGAIATENLRKLTPSIAFYRIPNQPGFVFWRVDYRDEFGAIHYTVTFQEDGSNPVMNRLPTKEEFEKILQDTIDYAERNADRIQHLEQEKGDQLFWSLEEKAEYLGSPLPSDKDMPLLEAQQLAKNAIMKRFGLSSNDLDALPWGAYYSYYETEAMTTVPAYSITFVVDNLNLYGVIVNAATGEILLLQGPDEGNG